MNALFLSPLASYDSQDTCIDVSDFFDEAGKVPWISVISGTLRAAFGALILVVSLVAWPILQLLGAPTVCAKDGVAFGAQHVFIGLAEVVQSKLYLYKELKNFSIGFVTSEGVRPKTSEWRFALHAWKDTLGQAIRQLID